MNNGQQYALNFNDQGTAELVKVEVVYANICGKVTEVNTKNNHIFKLFSNNTKREFRCLSEIFLPLQEGDAIYGKCKYDQFTQYGEQLTFLTPPFVILSQDKESILKCFLRALRGNHFGNKSACELYDHLISHHGNLEGLLKYLDRLAYHWYKHNDESVYTSLISVLAEGNIKILLGWWYKNRVLRRLYLLGFTNGDIRNINLSPLELYDKILKNPYLIPEIPIEKCDQIITQMDKPIDPIERNCGEMVRKIQSFMDLRGWTAVPSNIFLSLYPNAPEMIEKLKSEYGVQTHLRSVYLEYPYKVETEVTQIIYNLISSSSIGYTINPEEIIYTRNNLSDDQKKAISGALNNNLSIINGAAGSGKTTVINEIVHNLEKKGISYKVVSFTGKAVARLKEVLQKKTPSTMHRLIATKKEDKKKFQHLIIDEVSMVTTALFYEFKQKYNFDYKITMVGDMNQLQPISWGSLLDQLVKSQLVPTFSLTQIHRTGNYRENGILINSSAIIEYYNDDDAPPFEFTTTKNFNMFNGGVETVEELLKGLINGGILPDQIVIICPYNKKLSELNYKCQTIFNGDNRGICDSSGKEWKLRDRVMMMQNNYHINIMNKEEGLITEISDTEIKVGFKDGTSHIFQLNSSSTTETENKDEILTTSMLQHAYAITVDCSQGTEWPYVIYYLPEGSINSSFLNRNRLYTAITRAKVAIWCIGDLNAMTISATRHAPYRCEHLAKRLQESKTITLTNPTINK